MYTAAIDLGGTIVKIGLVKEGEVVASVQLESNLPAGLVANLPRIRQAVDGLLSRQQVTAAALDGVGLAFPGLVDPKECRVISTNQKYDDAQDFDLRGWAEAQWGVPFHLDNDARLAVVGEWYRGAAAGRDNVVMVTIGTGIGTGVIIEGKVLYGRHFQAGSLGGHFTLNPRGRRCSCGNIGCVETEASSFFLPDIIREHPALTDAFKRQAAGYGFREIFGLARQGHREATLLRDECMDVWAAATVTYIHAYDPEIVVVGGGVAGSADVLLPHIARIVDERAWCPSGKVEITVAALGDRAALAGLDYFLSRRRKQEV
ncbi:MAG: ROK family protein [Tannerella sp.]|jgi:glucokinase|nr:ROK family protein [Tannerella sp.]